MPESDRRLPSDAELRAARQQLAAIAADVWSIYTRVRWSALLMVLDADTTNIVARDNLLARATGVNDVH